MNKTYSLYCVILLSLFSFTAYAKTIEVIAIEYPPFTSLHMPNHGIAFELLNKETQVKDIKWQPLFYPPKRAAKIVNTNNWCASFYPVNNEDVSFKEYELSEETVKLGLIRRRQLSRFEWETLSELKGKSLALLNANKQSPFIQQFIQAGIKITFVESVTIALNMVLLNRVDFAFADSRLIDRNDLTEVERVNLQFSTSLLLETPIKIFINPQCGITLSKP